MASFNQRQQQQQMRQQAAPTPTPSPYPAPGGSVPRTAPSHAPQAPSPTRIETLKTPAEGYREVCGRMVREVDPDTLKGFIEKPVYRPNGAGSIMRRFEFDPDTGKVGEEVAFKGEY